MNAPIRIEALSGTPIRVCSTKGGSPTVIPLSYIAGPPGRPGAGLQDGDKGDVVVTGSNTPAEHWEVPELDLKADITWVQGELDLKANISDVQGGFAQIQLELDLKADLTYVDEQLALKANQAALDAEVARIDGELATKASTIYVDAQLEFKADLTGAAFTGDITVPGEAFGPGWDGSFEAPTKNDVYDKVAALEGLVIGAMVYKGTWDAATNTPAIPAAAGANKGHYRIVNVPGNTVIDGNGDWKLGDWIVSSGTRWDKIDNTDAVSSVNGYVGHVVLTKADVGLGNVANLAPADMPVSTAQQAALDLKLDDSQAGAFGLTLLATTTSVQAKNAIGLGNVDNTSDANKPVSGPQQLALDLKANLAGGNAFTGNQSVTGTVFAPSFDLYAAGPGGYGMFAAGTDVELRSASWLIMKAGGQTVAAVKGTGIDVLTGKLTVPDEAYGAPWDGSLSVPTKNAVFDQLEAVKASIPVAASGVVSDIVYGPGWNGIAGIAPSQNAVFDKIESIIASIPVATASVISDSPYGAAWDGIVTIAPSKNAVFDQFMAVQTALAGKQPTGNYSLVGHTHVTADITDLQGKLDTYIPLAQKGAPGGVPPLDGAGVIPGAYLPSYIDDVLEYPTLSAFPAVGETGKIYIALDTNRQYRWSGSVYVPLSDAAGSAVWGAITGSIAAQADLTAALAGKANLTGGNAFTGNQTITGNLTLSGTTNPTVQAKTFFGIGDAANSGGIALYNTDYTIGVECNVTTAWGFYWTCTHKYDFAINDVEKFIIDVAVNASLVPLTVPDEAYGPAWNAKLEAPTKNAVFDQMELKADKGTVTADLGLKVAKAGDTMTGNLVISNPNDSARLIMGPAGPHLYSEIYMRGAGNDPALGLHLMAGSSNAWLDADQFNFRNAAGTNLLAQLNATGVSFNGTGHNFGPQSGPAADLGLNFFATNYYHFIRYSTQSGGAMAVRATEQIGSFGRVWNTDSYGWNTLAGISLATLDPNLAQLRPNTIWLGKGDGGVVANTVVQIRNTNQPGGFGSLEFRSYTPAGGSERLDGTIQGVSGGGLAIYGNPWMQFYSSGAGGLIASLDAAGITMSVGKVFNAQGGIDQGQWVSEKAFNFYFPSYVDPNQKMRFYWPTGTRLQGRVEIVAVTGFDGASAGGFVKRTISMHAAENGAMYHQYSTTEGNAPTSAYMTISDLQWDAGSSRWYFVIATLGAAANAIGVTVKTSNNPGGSSIWWNMSASKITMGAVYSDAVAFPPIPVGLFTKIPDEPYGASWAAKKEPATKQDLYAKIEGLAVAGSGVTTFNTRSGAVTLLAGDVNTALGYVPVSRAGDTMTGPLNISMASGSANIILKRTDIAADAYPAYASIDWRSQQNAVFGSIGTLSGGSSVFYIQGRDGLNLMSLTANPVILSHNTVECARTSVNGLKLLVSQPSDPTQAQQLVFGEVSDNPGYRMKMGYHPGGVWEGVIDVIGGAAGAPLQLNPSTGPVNCGGNLAVAGLANVNSLNVQPVASGNGYMTISPTGGGIYSLLDMKGQGGSIALGLQITVGNGASYFSSDGHIFRKADGVSTIASFTEASAFITSQQTYFGWHASPAKDTNIFMRNTNYYNTFYMNSYAPDGTAESTDAMIQSYKSFGMILAGKPTIIMRAGATGQTPIATVSATGIDLAAGKVFSINGVPIGSGAGVYLPLTGGTLTGALVVTGTINAQSTVAGHGYVGLSPGNAGNSGYIEFYAPGGAGRSAYFGYTDAANVSMMAEGGRGFTYTGVTHKFMHGNTVTQLGRFNLTADSYGQLEIGDGSALRFAHHPTQPRIEWLKASGAYNYGDAASWGVYNSTSGHHLQFVYGTGKLATSGPIYAENDKRVFQHASNAFASANVNISSGVPSGGADGDIWLRYA